MMEFKGKIAKALASRTLKKKFGEQLRLEIKELNVSLENDGYCSIKFNGTAALPVETISDLLTGKENDK